MGADCWCHTSDKPDATAEQALLDIQASLLEQYDLPGLLAQHLAGAREALAETEQDDPYDLRDHWQREVERLEQIESAGIPDSVEGRLEVIRGIHDGDGEGIGSILDISHVADAGGLHITRPCDDAELERLVGSKHPPKREAERLAGPLFEQLGRGESVCFRVWSDDGAEVAGWCFVGVTVD